MERMERFKLDATTGLQRNSGNLGISAQFCG